MKTDLMSARELGFAETLLGDLTLRRRLEPRLGNREVYEVKLGEEYLMSSLFTEAEEQLATLGLAPLSGELDVVVGGLGLGYTAVEALKNDRLTRLLVIDIFQPVIDWHRNFLVPNGEILTNDTRCELRQGDFFALAHSGFDDCDPARKFDAVLLDIDHSPEHFLNKDTDSFYTTEGFVAIREQLKSNGTFAMWSDDPADETFTNLLGSAFGKAHGTNIEFANPYTGTTSLNSVYVAQRTP